MPNSFDLLHPKVREAVKVLGYSEPTRVQEKAIPVVLSGKHTLISAPTGSGKTEAAILPVLTMLLNSGNLNGIRVLYITPAKSLNRDLEYRIRKIAHVIGLKVAVRHGDTTAAERARQRREPPHILITTPETFQILLASPIMRSWLRGVGWVIVDEVHELMGSKRGIQLSVGLERLVELSGEFQRIALSATVGNLELASRLVGGVGRHVEVVNVNDVSRSMVVSVHYVKWDGDASTVAKAISSVVNMYSGSLLVFTNTRDMAEMLGAELRSMVNGVEVYHGSLSRERREAIEAALRNGDLKAVVTTSSLELGIDIGHIEAVVQFMSPRQSDRLIQRVGRSSHRVGGVARGHIVATTPDDYLESVVLARRAVENRLEGDYPYHEKALDVLLHQLAGIVLDHDGSVSVGEIYRIVRKAHPYSSLSMETLLNLINFASNILKLVSFHAEEGLVKARRGLRLYYLQNASMIPDERRFSVVNYSDGSTIGELDEDFALALEPNKVIVLAGKLWRVLSIDRERGVVMAEEGGGEGVLPEWIGDEIPVSYEVAQEVCRDREAALRGALRNVPGPVSLLDTDELKLDLQELSTDLNGTYPGVDNVVVEYTGDLITIHSCLGTKGNEALGLYISGYLTARYALAISYIRDAYRVILKTPRPINPLIIANALREDESTIVNIVRNVIKNSSIYRYRFVNVARRMGVLPKGKVDVNVDRLARTYNGTPLDEETINEIIVDKLDMDALINLARGVKNGSIKITSVARKPSKLALLIMNGLGARSIMPKTLPTNIVVDSVKRRIMSREITLLCLRCGWHITGRVGDLVRMELRCPRCGAKTITMLKYRDEDVNRALKILERLRRGLQLSKDEEEYLDELRERAMVIMDHGARGLVALSAHGVGVATVKRILSQSSTEDELYLSIIDAERDYIKSRAFWS